MYGNATYPIRAITWLLLAMVYTAFSTVHANYDSRVALVIGNKDYTGVPALQNAVNDANLISEKLTQLGFEVLQFNNLDYRGFNRAIREFGDVLQSAGGETAALFYYAGHAVQVDGSNYLIPVDAQIRKQSDFLVETVDMNTVLGTMEYARNPLNIIVLDACRDNPFTTATRGLTRGLARMDAPTGTLIAYATAPGKAALDGEGNNSPYTQALAKTIAKPGLPVEQMFKMVRINVMQSTGNQQIPWEASSLTGDFYFVEGEPKTITNAPPAPVEPARETQTPTFSQTPIVTQPAPANPSNNQASTAFTQSPSLPSQTKPASQPAFSATPAPTASAAAKPAKPSFAVSAVDDKAPTQLASAAPQPASREPRAPGQTFKDCDACPTMVVLPAGRLAMGEPFATTADSAQPVTRSISVTKQFAIGKYEVTFKEYDACVEANGCRHRPDDSGWGRANRPVVDVSWQHAQEYVGWLSKKTGKAYRLPSEAEWEYAAKGGTNHRFPWGDDLIANRANCWLCGSRWSNKQTAPVGSFLPNDFGLNDMAGNVWEWTEDCWNKTFTAGPATADAVTQGNCKLRVLRGGAFMTQPDSISVVNRAKQNSRFHRNFTGFRVAVSLN